MSFLAIKIDHQQAQEVRRFLRAIPEKIPTVFSRGINRTLVSTRAETIRQIRPVLPVKQTYLRNRIKIYNATRTYWRGKVWIGGKPLPLSVFGAKQTTRTHLVATTPRQSLWLYENVFRKKYGKAAKFSWHYNIKRRMPIVSYNLGKGRETLQPAWVTTIRNFDHVMMKKGAAPAGLIINQFGMVFVNVDYLFRKAAVTFSGLTDYAQNLLYKNIEDQMNLALKN